MDYKILVIDDDEPMHIMSKNVLGDEFELIHARDAQEGIDILSEQAVNLIMTDIHMPGISGLEFLESLIQDENKRGIPVLVITNLPTVEKEKKALELGAADFIEKNMFIDNKEEVVKRVRMKLVTNIDLAGLSDELVVNKKRLVARIMSEAISGDFKSTTVKLANELKEIFEIDSISFWSVENGEPKLISTDGLELPKDYGPDELMEEHTFQQLMDTKQSYLTNHVFNEELGILPQFSEDQNLPAEIGVPMFSLDEKRLLMNNMQIPEDARMFAFLILKRNKLFSSKEFEMISRLLIQTGSILWRLHKKETD